MFLKKNQYIVFVILFNFCKNQSSTLDDIDKYHNKMRVDSILKTNKKNKTIKNNKQNKKTLESKTIKIKGVGPQNTIIEKNNEELDLGNDIKDETKVSRPKINKKQDKHQLNYESEDKKEIELKISSNQPDKKILKDEEKEELNKDVIYNRKKEEEQRIESTKKLDKQNNVKDDNLKENAFKKEDQSTIPKEETIKDIFSQIDISESKKTEKITDPVIINSFKDLGKDIKGETKASRPEINKKQDKHQLNYESEDRKEIELKISSNQPDKKILKDEEKEELNQDVIYNRKKEEEQRIKSTKKLDKQNNVKDDNLKENAFKKEDQSTIPKEETIKDIFSQIDISESKKTEIITDPVIINSFKDYAKDINNKAKATETKSNKKLDKNEISQESKNKKVYSSLEVKEINIRDKDEDQIKTPNKDDNKEEILSQRQNEKQSIENVEEEADLNNIKNDSFETKQILNGDKSIKNTTIEVNGTVEEFINDRSRTKNNNQKFTNSKDNEGINIITENKDQILENQNVQKQRLKIFEIDNNKIYFKNYQSRLEKNSKIAMLICLKIFFKNIISKYDISLENIMLKCTYLSDNNLSKGDFKALIMDNYKTENIKKLKTKNIGLKIGSHIITFFSNPNERTNMIQDPIFLVVQANSKESYNGFKIKFLKKNNKEEIYSLVINKEFIKQQYREQNN